MITKCKCGASFDNEMQLRQHIMIHRRRKYQVSRLLPWLTQEKCDQMNREADTENAKHGGVS